MESFSIATLHRHASVLSIAHYYIMVSFSYGAVLLDDNPHHIYVFYLTAFPMIHDHEIVHRRFNT